NKCLLLFGAAVVLIIVAALSVPWLRMNGIIEESNRRLARQLVQVWEEQVQNRAAAGAAVIPGEPEQLADADIVLLRKEQVVALADEDRFVARAWQRFQSDPDAVERYDSTWSRAGREDRYAKVQR